MTFASPPEARPPDHPPVAAYAMASLDVDFHRPTPHGVPLTVRSRIEGEVGRHVRVRTELGPEGE